MAPEECRGAEGHDSNPAEDWGGPVQTWTSGGGIRGHSQCKGGGDMERTAPGGAARTNCVACKRSRGTGMVERTPQSSGQNTLERWANDKEQDKEKGQVVEEKGAKGWKKGEKVVEREKRTSTLDAGVLGEAREDQSGRHEHILTPQAPQEQGWSRDLSGTWKGEANGGAKACECGKEEGESWSNRAGCHPVVAHIMVEYQVYMEQWRTQGR